MSDQIKRTFVKEMDEQAIGLVDALTHDTYKKWFSH